VPVLRALSEKVSARLKKAGIAGRTVVLKLKTQDFKIRTRNRQLGDPTRLADRIFHTGLQLLEKETDGTKYRLLGIGVSDLTDAGRADPPDLVDVRRASAPWPRARSTCCAKNSGAPRWKPATPFGKGRNARRLHPRCQKAVHGKHAVERQGRRLDDGLARAHDDSPRRSGQRSSRSSSSARR
jgi:DNA polymerase-4